ncbi:hypothetical protein Fmac_014725 [Flemingia macrophylla]|uniref:Uncharacterized protein n=1 Tax=Flemingia macrophylla TaxID=520843 RepID=A0ABD1MD21_9FABA
MVHAEPKGVMLKGTALEWLRAEVRAKVETIALATQVPSSSANAATPPRPAPVAATPEPAPSLPAKPPSPSPSPSSIAGHPTATS